MRKNVKSNLGITLVALVITIIILLILAGVTLSLTLGENGLLKRTELAKEEYENAGNKEETGLEQITNSIDNYIGDTNKEERITAEMVSFTPEDAQWHVENVKEALDYLYSK